MDLMRKAIRRAHSYIRDVPNQIVREGQRLGDASSVSRFIEGGAGAVGMQLGMAARATVVGQTMAANVQATLADEGTTLLRALTRNAVQGAAIGAATGGTMEFLQGGSFWEGAVSGAQTGALGLPAYRMAMRATGATSYINPLGRRGVVRRAYSMYQATSPNANVSKQVTAILGNDMMARMANQMMRRA